ncbi:killer cell lectin-like receptor subfamily B member 1B allele B [Opisthocomus hoazin]|uniref:killer cell lectin-like receptor subfamily B member 1B allele B n=1 Tax=Opisthocomus hoazin TaxID=30419 RepID=UPI003F5374C4
MSENLIYADLNLAESTKPRLQKVTDVQGSTYAEVKVQSLDTNAAAGYTSSDPSSHTATKNFKDSRRGKSCCPRTGVAVLVAVIILLLVLAVCLILMYHPTASSPPDSKPSSDTSEEALGCPLHWEKMGKKCYYFFKSQHEQDWNTSRKQCTGMDSDLVIIDSTEELNYLCSRSEGQYYLLGLTYSESDKKWKWINNMEHSTDMFPIKGEHIKDYLCTVIGHKCIETAPCGGDSSTQNMCQKAASISDRLKEKQ